VTAYRVEWAVSDSEDGGSGGDDGGGGDATALVPHHVHPFLLSPPLNGSATDTPSNLAATVGTPWAAFEYLLPAGGAPGAAASSAALVPGVAYAVRVTAVNAAGGGSAAAASPVSAVPRLRPVTPRYGSALLRALSADDDATSIAVSCSALQLLWAPPVASDARGAAITAFAVDWAPLGSPDSPAGAGGPGGRPEVQSLTLSAGVEGGGFAVGWDGTVSAPLPWNVDAAGLKAALEGLPGLPEVDVDDMRAHCEYRGFNESHPAVQWFWQVVREEFDREQRALLLQFVTGTSRVPARGFAHLQVRRRRV